MAMACRAPMAAWARRACPPARHTPARWLMGRAQTVRYARKLRLDTAVASAEFEIEVGSGADARREFHQRRVLASSEHNVGAPPDVSISTAPPSPQGAESLIARAAPRA